VILLRDIDTRLGEYSACGRARKENEKLEGRERDGIRTTY
jgi:hypothetical protein